MSPTGDNPHHSFDAIARWYQGVCNWVAAIDLWYSDAVDWHLNATRYAVSKDISPPKHPPSSAPFESNVATDRVSGDDHPVTTAKEPTQ